ncbi:hypothetical protein [Brevibacillus laterosporus]|uniref:Uncharacterized protein n=1 Tax=Brevibacillus laterosporus TaxID=1465 RepID=A0AAP3DM39_BRELA|nr:hypothetical protein [Brevibacillus laterosporus]AYB39671.1 hypothetical protein D5F52_16105 [Brevibacillus laterosporus]MBM7109094.1 hypothetical protein [Brevibacillus laterosporus]MCR8983335.1 hypothetical protein [Brevibacillus laterosporus]MCZ0810491.1 hypothetical protein [Brevibacillus laterosporus]MCZ0828548.1 hypothetical protein [Brevibacillus laterosporus]
MLTNYALERQKNALESLFYSAEVELDGELMTVPVLVTHQGPTKVTFLLRLVDSRTGRITKRIIKDSNGVIVWQDEINIVKPPREIALSIPIELQWKAGE